MSLVRNWNDRKFLSSDTLLNHGKVFNRFKELSVGVCFTIVAFVLVRLCQHFLGLNVHLAFL